jgi:hypothetical protein
MHADTPSGLTTPPQPGRPWFQFRLRTLIGTTTVICLLLAMGGHWRHRAERQARAVAVLEEMGAVVKYESDANDGERPWLRHVLGDDYFFSIVEVHNDHRNARSGADVIRFWDAVASLPRLESLFAAQDWVSGNRPFRAIRGHTRLRELTLCEGTITDNDLEGIDQLVALEYLSLAKCPVGDKALLAASRLPRLRELKVYETRISDAGIASLARCQSLETLWIEATDVTDDGLMQLTECRNLRRMDVYGTRVSKQGMERFRRIMPGVQFAPR